MRKILPFILVGLLGPLGLAGCRTVGAGARVANAFDGDAEADGQHERLDKGARVKRSGNMPCRVAALAPVYERETLTAVDFSCGDSGANGRFACAPESLCRRGAAALNLYEDRVEVSAGEDLGVFARGVFAMDASIQFYKDDGRCNTPVVATLTYRGGDEDEAAMKAACDAAAGEAWGAKLPGDVCKDTADGPVAEICAAEIREAIRLALEAAARK